MWYEPDWFVRGASARPLACSYWQKTSQVNWSSTLHCCWSFGGRRNYTFKFKKSNQSMRPMCTYCTCFVYAKGFRRNLSTTDQPFQVHNCWNTVWCEVIFNLLQGLTPSAMCVAISQMWQHNGGNWFLIRNRLNNVMLAYTKWIKGFWFVSLLEKN